MTANSSDRGPVTRPTLLMRLRDARDDRAWEEFVNVYGPILYRFARWKGFGDDDANDAMQEVLLQVHRSINSFEYAPQRGRFRSWLGSILRSKLIAILRKRRKEPRWEHGAATVCADDFEGGLESAWDQHSQEEITRLALVEVKRRMSDVTWRAFSATWLENRSPQEVAAELRQDLAWVYVAKSRGMRLLREVVARLAEDAPWAEIEGRALCRVN